MSFEEIDEAEEIEEIYEQPLRRRLAVQEAAEILGLRAHTLHYETEGLDPIEPAWACTVALNDVLEIQELR